MRIPQGLKLIISILAVVVLVAAMYVLVNNCKEGFLGFPPFHFPLEKPTVHEEIGTAMVYPQGDGVGMNITDSNQLSPACCRDTLLTAHLTPPSYGESGLADPKGMQGAQDGCRVLDIKSNGRPDVYQPTDLGENCTFISGNQPINYAQNWDPSSNLKLGCSGSQTSQTDGCYQTYPKLYKTPDGTCITAGDLPYFGSNPPNPRMVSRWQTVTGDYKAYDNQNLVNCGGNLFPNTYSLSV